MERLYERMKQHMEYLCLTCGPRQCGSQGERMAADYIEQEFQTLGYETTREEYPTIGWNCRKFQLWNVTQDREVPCATAAYFSCSAEVEDRFVWITEEQLEDLESMELKGKLCFVVMTDFGKQDTPIGMFGVEEKLDVLGAKGAVFISSGFHTDLKPSTKMPRSPFLQSMGAATVSEEGAYDIAKHPDDVYRLVIEAEKFDTMSCNVIARRPGGEKKGVIGAHYDTAPLIQGAQDNASGTAAVLELARLYRDQYPEWTFEFCAFSGEEYIPEDFALGSKDYVMRHGTKDINWYLNIDGGYSLFGYRMLLLSHKEQLPKLQLDHCDIRENEFHGDERIFSLHGVPTIMFGPRHFFKEFHTELDSLDQVSFEKMEEYAAINARLLEQLVK